MAPMVPDCAQRPIMLSEKKIGIESTRVEIRYMMMKAAPPPSPTIYGKRHMLPSPMAEPAIAIITAKRLPKFSRFCICLRK